MNPRIYHVNEDYDLHEEFVMTPLITTDALHAILWKLFDCENPLLAQYSLEMRDGNKSIEQLHYIRGKQWTTPDKLAEALWIKYTSGKEPMWQHNPSSPSEVRSDESSGA